MANHKNSKSAECDWKIVRTEIKEGNDMLLNLQQKPKQISMGFYILENEQIKRFAYLMTDDELIYVDDERSKSLFKSNE